MRLERTEEPPYPGDWKHRARALSHAGGYENTSTEKQDSTDSDVDLYSSTTRRLQPLSRGQVGGTSPVVPTIFVGQEDEEHAIFKGGKYATTVLWKSLAALSKHEETTEERCNIGCCTPETVPFPPPEWDLPRQR